MSAYGGVTRTGYGAQGNDDSGGFFAGGSQQGSQAVKSYQDESLRPVTIKQILDAEEAYSGADFKIDGSAITQITFIGQVRAINPQPTNITIRLDDGTGQIDVKKWIDADKQDDADPGFGADTHVRVFGRLKSFSNKRHVAAHVMRPVADFNEVNYHLLEATYVHLLLSRGAIGGDGAGDGESMFVDGGAGMQQQHEGGGGGAGGQIVDSKLPACSAVAQRMYAFMRKTSGGEGLHLNAVSSGTGMSVREVLTAADELLSLGMVYTTVDDETWAVLEL